MMLELKRANNKKLQHLQENKKIIPDLPGKAAVIDALSSSKCTLCSHSSKEMNKQRLALCAAVDGEHTLFTKYQM